MPNPRPRKYPKVSTENLIRSSRDDFGVPTPLNQAIGRRFSEQEQADRKAADMKMSPLDRLKARLEAGAVIGSGIFESVQQLPKLLQGEDSYNEAIAKRMYEPRSNPEKSYEYVGDVADFLEKLETEYKIPQLLPQLMAYQPLMSTANQQVKKAVDRGATKAGMAVERALEKPVTDIMNRGGVGADLLGSFNTDPSRIVKSSGGNWLTGKASNSFEDRLKKMTPYLDQKSAIETQKAKIASMENSGTSSQRTLANVKANLKELEAEQAVNNWVTKNIGNYIKKEMATPEDPVRLMFEKRAQEIEAQFQVDMNRAERTRARAEAEEDPRRKANLTRQAGREEEQAKFDRDFANEYATHLPKDEYGPDEGALNDLRERRVEEGFPAEGIAKSEPAKKWEELADDAIFVRRAKDLQKQKDAYDAYRSTELEYLNMSDQIKKEYAAIITKKIQDTGAQFSDKQLQNIIDNMPLDDKAKAVGEEIEFRRLQNNYFDAKNKSSSGLLAMAEENPWVEKLAPTEKLYSGRIGGLELDHVIDVIKQDVAAGRIRPDQLNKLSMDQAIKRTAEFNMEQAKKMRETAIKNMEGFPTYKDYGDEGYKWIELKRPEDLTELPQTHQLEPYESKVHGGTAYRVVNKETGMKGEGFKTPERATQEFLKEHSEERLAEALKYEGDTMGHCVGGYCPDVVSGKSRIYSLRDSRGEPHVTIEVNPNQHLDYNDWFKKQPEEIQNRIAQRRLEDKDHNIYEGPEYLAAREALPPKIRQIKGKQNARPIEKYDPYTQDFVRSGEWSDVGDLKNTGLIKQDGKYMTQAEYDDYLLNELKPPPEPPIEGMKRGGAVHISNNPDTMAMELQNQRYAGGGIVRGLKQATKRAAKNAGKEAQNILPAAERDANLEKFLSTSQEKRRLYHATPADFKEFQGKGFDPTISGNATWLTPNKERQPAAHNTSSRTNVYREGVNVMPVYIKAERPLVLDDQIMEDWAKAVYANDSPEFPFLIAPDSLKKIKEDGYDSIFHPRSGEIIMLEPNKIKSAIGNRGTYDIEDPDITKAKGGAIRMSDNSDVMRMELNNKKFAMGGAVGENDVGSPSPQNSASPVPSFQFGGVVKKAAAKSAKAVKPSLVIKSEPSLIVSNLIDEEPNIAKRLGAEARAKRQKAIEAEGKRQEAAKQTQPSVGYRPSTPQKPDPLVGTRFVNEPAFGLNPNEPFDITKFKGGSGMVLPWDSQSRNVKTTQVSGVDLPNQIFDVTHGGIPYAFDTQHVAKGIAGASGEDISKRIKTRSDIAVKANKDRGGTGELLHFPITMGYRAEDYALPYSEFSFDIINHKLMTGELTKREADELSEMVRNFTPPGKKYKGTKPFAEFAGFTEPEGLNQIYTGEGLKVPSGELRKAIADRIIWQKGSQEKLGFNAEDLMNATTYEPLRGVDKGFIGSTAMRNTPTGMQLSPSAGKYPYDTDFSGEHLGRLDDLVDVEALFHRTLNPIKHELITRENLIPYNKESLRNAAIGAIEKRKEGVSQPIDQQFLDDYNDYINELKKPHEYRVGGSVKAKNKYSSGGALPALMKHAETVRQSPLMNYQRK